MYVIHNTYHSSTGRAALGGMGEVTIPLKFFCVNINIILKLINFYRNNHYFWNFLDDWIIISNKNALTIFLKLKKVRVYFGFKFKSSSALLFAPPIFFASPSPHWNMCSRVTSAMGLVRFSILSYLTYETANRLQIRRFLHPQNSQKSVLIYRFHLRKNHHSETMLRASVCCACALKTWVVESS